MKGRVSPLLRKILSDSEAKDRFMRIILREADSNVLEFDGNRYVVDTYGGSLSSFYKDKIKKP